MLTEPFQALCSLSAPFKGALPPFPNQNGDSQFYVQGIYDIYMLELRVLKERIAVKIDSRHPSNIFNHWSKQSRYIVIFYDCPPRFIFLGDSVPASLLIG